MPDDVWEKLARWSKSAQERAERQPDENGLRAGENIMELLSVRQAINGLIDAEIIRGREQGAPWTLLGSSKQQAQQRHKAALARVKRR